MTKASKQLNNSNQLPQKQKRANPHLWRIFSHLLQVFTECFEVHTLRRFSVVFGHPFLFPEVPQRPFLTANGWRLFFLEQTLASRHLVRTKIISKDTHIHLWPHLVKFSSLKHHWSRVWLLSPPILEKIGSLDAPSNGLIAQIERP